MRTAINAIDSHNANLLDGNEADELQTELQIEICSILDTHCLYECTFHCIVTQRVKGIVQTSNASIQTEHPKSATERRPTTAGIWHNDLDIVSGNRATAA